MIIAIDGPAASGKGTLGKRLAKHYGYRHLDTGVIYRAVAKALLDAGADLTNEMLAVSAALELDPEKFGNPALKTQEVGDAASVVSAIPKVREVLVNFQRQFAADPPGAVLDERDQNRHVAPLKAAPDAYLLDNSYLDIEGGVRAAIEIVEAVRAGRQRV